MESKITTFLLLAFAATVPARCNWIPIKGPHERWSQSDPRSNDHYVEDFHPPLEHSDYDHAPFDHHHYDRPPLDYPSESKWGHHDYSQPLFEPEHNLLTQAHHGYHGDYHRDHHHHHHQKHPVIPSRHTVSTVDNAVPYAVPHHIPIHITRAFAVPVHVAVPVEVPRGVEVPVSHPVPVDVPRPVAVPVPRPVPVPIPQRIPFQITQPVGVPVPQPVPVHVPRPLPVPVPQFGLQGLLNDGFGGGFPNFLGNAPGFDAQFG